MFLYYLKIYINYCSLCYNHLVSNIKIVKVDNIGDIKLEQYEDCSNTLFIAATRSLTYQLKTNNNVNVFDVTQIDNIIKVMLKEKHCLSESEMRYVLHKTIMKLEDEKLKIAFKNSEKQLYELYNNLLLAELNINDIKLSLIYRNNLISNANIFKLYIDYCKELKLQGKNSYQKEYNLCMQEITKPYKKVSLVGFLFFKDNIHTLLRYLIKNQQLSSFFINDNMIAKNLIIPFLNDNNISYEYLETTSCEISKFDNLRKHIFDKETINRDISEDIVFYKPFFTREDEFKFIISQIKDILCDSYTIEEIQSKCEKIAIVIVSQFAKQTEIFNDLLKRQGLFIAPNNEIFFSQEEFLNSSYEKSLSKKQRLELFSEFKRLEVYQPPKTLFNSNLGKFICEIYKISSYGMKLYNFNTLIYINWLFKETKIEDIISEFNYIKSFFENLETIDEWLNQIEKLINIKNKETFEYELHNHPIKSVKKETLDFIRNYIVFLNNVIKKIRNVNGSVKKHIKTLIGAIKEENPDKSLEKELLYEFETILNAKDNSINIDNEYFAQNFQSLISEYLSARSEKSNNIRINVINMESANSYDTVFVPMFEENKYPMEYKYEFPYSRGIIDIISNKKLITNYNIPLNKTQNYSLKMAKHIFENLFRIAKDKIIFTRTESENGAPIDMSIFGYDIISKFGGVQFKEHNNYFQTLKEEEYTDKLIFKENKLKDMYLNEMLSYFVCPKMFYYSNLFEKYSCYADKFLLNFYCKGLIYNKLLSEIADGSIYNEDSLKQTINKNFIKIAENIFELFPLFDDNYKNDITLSARVAISNFINNKIFTGRYKPNKEFKLSLSTQKDICYKGLKIKRYKNLVVTDILNGVTNEFDISKMLDILITSTGKRQTNKKHFSEIVSELNQNKTIDRASSLNFLSFKLNTQLNVSNYENAGIERVKKIVDFIDERRQSNLCASQSSYCSYCKYKNICMGVVDYE